MDQMEELEPRREYNIVLANADLRTLAPIAMTSAYSRIGLQADAALRSSICVILVIATMTMFITCANALSY